MIRVAPYSRVSTDAEDQLNSLENQISYYTSMVRERDEWILVDMYVDEGITGTNTNIHSYSDDSGYRSLV